MFALAAAAVLLPRMQVLSIATELWLAVFLVLICVLITSLLRRVRGRTMLEQARQENREKAHHIHLVVRPAWAAIAVAADLAWLVLLTAAGAVALAWHPTTASPDGAGLAIGSIATAAMLAAYEYAHRRATDPAKPQRAHAPGTASPPNT